MRTNNFTYNLQKRETKTKGVVFDVYFYYTDADGRQVQKKLSGFKTKAEAIRAYSAFMEQALVHPAVKKEKAKILFYEDARRAYFSATAPFIKESTLYIKKHVAEKYHDVFFKRKNMYAMTKDDLIAYQEWLWERKRQDGSNISQKHAVGVYGHFMAFYRWCIEKFEVPNISAPMQKKRTQRLEYTVWTRADFEKFIACVDNPKYKAFFYVMFFSGARVGEVQALKVKDYDFKTLYIHATYSKLTLDDSTYKITETKNYKAHRVPLPAPCRAVLDEWVKNRKPDEFLFGKTAPISTTPIRKYFDRIIGVSGVPRIRIHDLRHSFATMLITEYHASIPAAAGLLGDTIAQFVKTYAHIIEQSQYDVVNAII